MQIVIQISLLSAFTSTSFHYLAFYIAIYHTQQLLIVEVVPTWEHVLISFYLMKFISTNISFYYIHSYICNMYLSICIYLSSCQSPLKFSLCCWCYYIYIFAWNGFLMLLVSQCINAHPLFYYKNSKTTYVE